MAAVPHDYFLIYFLAVDQPSVTRRTGVFTAASPPTHDAGGVLRERERERERARCRRLPKMPGAS
jgi:hypothetical protein